MEHHRNNKPKLNHHNKNPKLLPINDNVVEVHMQENSSSNNNNIEIVSPSESNYRSHRTTNADGSFMEIDPVESDAFCQQVRQNVDSNTLPDFSSARPRESKRLAFFQISPSSSTKTASSSRKPCFTLPRMSTRLSSFKNLHTLTPIAYKNTHPQILDFHSTNVTRGLTIHSENGAAQDIPAQQETSSNTNQSQLKPFNYEQQSTSNSSSQGPSTIYSDLGDCDQVCEHCHACFWYAERLKGYPPNQRPNYNRCCKGGKVRLPLPMEPPEIIKHLFKDRHFMENIRAYNMMFAMTSFGAKVDDTVNNGSAPYVFKVQGQISHWMGSLCPPADHNPRFLQMYIYDTDNEVSNRLRYFAGDDPNHLKTEIVKTLVQILDEYNELIKLFRITRDICLHEEPPEFEIRLYNSGNRMRYDAPAQHALGAIVYDSGPRTKNDFDIVIRKRDGPPQRISKLHPSYMALQFPLLCLSGEHGWSIELKLVNHSSRADKQLTMNMFYSFQLHDRFNLYALLPRGGRLFQQYLVNAYMSIEKNRLDYNESMQDVLRSEYLQGIHDALLKGDSYAHDVGKRIILPASFTGGPRYMYKHYQDALAICRVHGNPQYFITYTCNVKWREIQNYLKQYPEMKAEDRPNVIARIFQMKVQHFIDYVKSEKPFGQVVAELYTIEFQKRGLPHCHTLLWVAPSHRIKTLEQLDDFISAEIPDPDIRPELYKIVTELMMHGPCGLAKIKSPCMIDGVCSKHFPKQYEDVTQFDKDGYVHYRRRNDGRFALKKGIKLDNGYVVPYNKNLLLVFQAHINVEYCGWSMLIKYLFKYISKGADRIRAKLTRSPGQVADNVDTKMNKINEIQNFVDARFICPHEAAWRIFNFDIHHRNPPVQVLAVHLENMQTITLKDKQPCGELFYLRMLLSHQVGCRTFDEIKKVGEVIFPTYRAACEKLGLLADDKEWMYVFDDASAWATAEELRSLFAHILLFCDVANPVALWTQQWRRMSDDIVRRVAADSHIVNLHVNDVDLQHYVLYELEILLNSNNSSSLCDYGLPMPPPFLLSELKNKLLMEERNYDRVFVRQENEILVSKLNSEQHLIYDTVVKASLENQRVLMFVYGHGGTGKTFLWTTITSALRSGGKIVLAVASSGIASLLLPSGRTAHSRFKIPLDLTNNSVCHIKKSTQLARLLFEATLIIWDEAPMTDRKCFEALDKTLKDILVQPTKPFGCKSVLLGGDFRQTLPVKPKGAKKDIIASSIAQSSIWTHFKIYKLSENMRLIQPNVHLEEKKEIAAFSSWLLQIGDGHVGVDDENDLIDTKWVEIPEKFIIPDHEEALKDLVRFIYDEKILQNPTATMFCDKAIVCPKNETADEINTLIMSTPPGKPTIYLSVDSIIPHANDRGDTEVLYPPEYLNLLNFSGFTTHRLELKVGVPIMLIRNMNQMEGLCNGTRMIITQLLPRLIQAEVIIGVRIGHKVYIPRIALNHNDKELPFVFKRKQFPVRVCFAMIINKSQGQSLKKIGIYLPEPVFSHGQLYVALSRATSATVLKILIKKQDGLPSNWTKI